MDSPERNDPLEILLSLGNLLAREADQNKTVLAMLNFLKGPLKMSKVGAVVLSAGGESRVFCARDETCDDCPGDWGIIHFARRVLAVERGIVAGERLLSLMTETEKRCFKLKRPLFFPVMLEGRVFGALWGEGEFDEEGLTAAARETLALMSPLICVAFRSVFIYESLLSQEKILKSILDNLDANIYVSDLENDDILFINKKMSKEFGLGAAVTGEKCWRALQSGMTERCPFCPSRELARDHSRTIVWEEHNTATHQYYKNTDSVIEWLNGKHVHLQHSVDITAEKASLRNLEEARAQAELASRAKGDFLSRMSHEIRTPINAIIGMSRLAAEADDPARVRECIRKIDSSSKQLLALINDVLDMAKIEAGKMELSAAPFDLEKTLIDIANVISARSEEKGQKLVVGLEPVRPGWLRGDEMRLSQVIINLLSNAVKFTPPSGTVRLSVRVEEAGGGRARLRVSVADTGIGIPKERQGALFQSFEQADGGITRKFGGTGLGLSISRNIVRLMGGDIALESEEGRGSVFSFAVELDRAAPPETGVEKYLAGLETPVGRALLIDAEEDARLSFAAIMDDFHLQCETAAGLDEGLRRLDRARRDGGGFDLVFVDWDTVPGPGPGLGTEIRRRFGADVIVVGSLARWGALRSAPEGRDLAAHLSKPWFAATIAGAVREARGLHEARSGFAETHRGRLAGYHVLLAEDVEINREIVHQALEGTGLQITDAVDGRVALDLVRAGPGRYDLILMDVNMPEMDGYEATRLIRQLPFEHARTVPILAMTANAFSEDIQKSLASGLDDHLTKPLHFETLIAKLHQHLEGRAPGLVPAGSENKGSGAALAPASGAGGGPSSPWVDVESGLERLGGDGEFYADLLARFLEQTTLNALTDAFENKDFAAAAQAAHGLKGVAGNLSLTALHASVSALETALKNGGPDRAPYQAVLSHFAATRAAVERLLQEGNLI